MAKIELIKEKTPMPAQAVSVRIRNFNEVALGYNKTMALKEAQRCIQCKNRSCVQGCPVEVPIPEFISLLKDEKYHEALMLIKEKNVLPGICGRVCPQETQCEAFCAKLPVKYHKRSYWEGGQAAPVNSGINTLAPDTDIILYMHGDTLFPGKWFEKLDYAWDMVFESFYISNCRAINGTLHYTPNLIIIIIACRNCAY